MVTAMWSVSNRTGTSNSKSAVTSTPSAGAVPKVTSPVVVSTDQPEACRVPSRYLHRADDRLGDGADLDHAPGRVMLLRQRVLGLAGIRTSWPP
jgi:hypothetical protein